MSGRSARPSVAIAALLCAAVLMGCGAGPTPTPSATPTRGVGPTAVVPPSRLGITFVDNDCFLLMADEKKILIDPHERIPFAAVKTAIQKAQPPFDGVDLILVTHNHGDHFDAALVGPQLLLNPDAVLATTQEVADALKAGFSAYDKVQERVKVFGPAEGERVEVTLGGVELEVLYLSHDYAVFNLGFILRLGGKKLLHTGDTFPPHLLTYDFPKDDLDIAFIPYFWLTDATYLTDGKATALDSIRARQYVAMHHTEGKAGVNALLNQAAERCPDCIILRESMTTHIAE